MAGPYDIFINIWQSNNFSSYHFDPLVDVGHARIFQMEKGPGIGAVTQVTSEPLSYQGAAIPDSYNGPPIGHILAFCRDYYLPNRLEIGRNILIIPNAMGGTGFSNSNFAGSGPSYPGWGVCGAKKGDFHEDTIARVNSAMATYPGSRIIACFCQGGEADAQWIPTLKPDGSAGSYVADDPQAFIDYTVAEVADFRTRWTGGADVPFLFGQMSPKYYELPPLGAAPGYKMATNVALEEMATHVANSISIPSDGLTTNNWDLRPTPPHEDIYDEFRFIHYDAESQRGSATQTNPLSRRYWTGFQELVPGTGFQWKPLKVGGGGYCTKLDFSSDGTKVMATDVMGGYIAPPGRTVEWTQLYTTDRFPSEVWEGYTQPGVVPGTGFWDIAISWQDSNVIYVVPHSNGGLYRSGNKGVSFQKTNLANITGRAGGANNGAERFYSPMMAVDPRDKNHVIIGTPTQGMWRTTNGMDFTQCTGITLSTNRPGYAGVCFDPVSPADGNGRTSVAYASRVGTSGAAGECWRSTTSGASWTNIGGPFPLAHATDPNAARPGFKGRCSRAEPAGQGVYYVGDGLDAWMYKSGTWTKFTKAIGGSIWGFAADPTHAGRVYFFGDGGVDFQLTNNYGADAFLGNFWSGNWPGIQETVSDRIPWRDAPGVNSGYISFGDAMFDPINNDLWMADGFGGRRCEDMPTDWVFGATMTWQDESVGTEILVGEGVLAPRGSENVTLAFWDLGSWRRTAANFDDYPTHDDKDPGQPIIACWGMDYAYDNPDTRVLCESWYGKDNAQITQDGGHTWTKLAASPVFTTLITSGVAAAGQRVITFSTPIPGQITAGMGVSGHASIDGAITASDAGSTVTLDRDITGSGLPAGTSVLLARSPLLGNVAVATPTNAVILAGFNTPPFYTTDGFATLNPCQGLPADGWFQVGPVTSNRLAADRVNTGTFYAHNYGASLGLYRSTDNGANWTRRTTFIPDHWGTYNSKIISVPGIAGVVFHTISTLIDDTAVHPLNDYTLHRYDDATSTWTKPNPLMGEPVAFAFGAPRTGDPGPSNPPTIFVAGWYDGEWGYYLSEDLGVTYTLVTDFPMGRFDGIHNVAADMNTFGRFYVCFGGSGFVYSTYGDAPPVEPPTELPTYFRSPYNRRGGLF
jgi:hypothetical protein